MNKTKVLLLTFNVCGNFSLAFGYLKAYALKDKLIRERVIIDILDLCKDCNDIEQALFSISRISPKIVGFSCYCWNMEKILKLSPLIKQLNPEIKIVLGGPEVGPISKKYLQENPAIDIIVRGEGEVTFSQIIKHFALNEGKLEKIKGISYRKNGKIFSNPDQPLIENLDEIPSPFLTKTIVPQDKVTYLETYRGCPFSCAYCYEGKNYPKLRFFSDERVKSDLEFILSQENVKSFSFIDPVFNLNQKNVKKLSSMISKLNKFDTKLHTIEIACEKVNKATVSLLKKANVVSVETGPQTINAQVLRNVKREFDKSKFKKGIELLLKNDIKVISDLIIGLPGDNFFSFVKSIKFVFNLKPSTIIFSTLHVLPGTHLHENAQKLGLVFYDAPPHYIISNQSFSYEEIRKASIMANSLEKEYNLKNF